MKKLLVGCVIVSSCLYGSGDLQEQITNADAPITSKAYFALKHKWYDTKSGASVSLGTWHVMWDQSSTSSDILTNKNDALNVNYDIEDSLASVLTIKANYRLLAMSLEYYSTGVTAKDDEEVSGLNLGLTVTDLIPYIDTEFRVNSANFKGSILATEQSDGTTASETPSSGKFETQLNIYDFIIYPFNKYVGFGYRKYKYDFPQDMYVMRNSDNSGISRGLANIEYSGDFATVIVDNKRRVDDGIIYSAMYGQGKLIPKASGYENWLEDSDATLSELFLGYGYKTKNQGVKFNFVLGYKYNKIETTMNKKDGAYTLATQFDTEFHGPFVKFALIY
jgi:hypothetical protein